MKLPLLFLVFLPALASAQQLVKPSSVTVNSKASNMDVAQSNIATLTNEIKTITEQMKDIKDQINSLRQKQSFLATERTKVQNQINGLKAKKNLSGTEEAQIQQLESEIKNIDSNMQGLQNSINTKNKELAYLEKSTQEIENKIETIEQRSGQDQSKQKDESNELTTEAGITYAKMKVILDSLSTAEKSGLSSVESSTVAYFDNLFRTNPAFASATLKELNFLRQQAAMNGNQKNIAGKQDHNLSLEKMKQYLQQLASIRETRQL